MARSGFAAVALLQSIGAMPIAYDAKTEVEMQDQISKHEPLGCETQFGVDPLPLVDCVSCVVISPGVPIDAPLVQRAKAKGIPVIAEIELAFRHAKGTVCAVTGTNGKTTTVSLLGDMLTKAGRSAQVSGNVGYPFSLSAMQSRDEDVHVVEVSSFQLESVDTFRPLVAVLLNITPDHLDRHGAMDRYIGLKKRLFACQRPLDHAVLNFDDPLCIQAAEGIAADVSWFSLKQNVDAGAFIQDGAIAFRRDGKTSLICAVKDVRIPGKHNLANALAAVTAASLLNVPPQVIRHALRTFAGVEHRIEYVRELEGVHYINDSKGTNPESTIKAVEAMQRPTVLIAGGFDKHGSFESLAEEVICSGMVRHAVLIGQTAGKLAACLRAAGFERITLADSLGDALYAARALAEPGYNVLLSPACASFDMFDSYEDRGTQFKTLVCGLQ